MEGLPYAYVFSVTVHITLYFGVLLRHLSSLSFGNPNAEHKFIVEKITLTTHC